MFLADSKRACECPPGQQGDGQVRGAGALTHVPGRMLDSRHGVVSLETGREHSPPGPQIRASYASGFA